MNVKNIKKILKISLELLEDTTAIKPVQNAELNI